jgi:hypothetical protein
MTKPTKTKTKNTAKTNTPLTDQLNAFAAEEDGNSASTVALLAPANFKKAPPKTQKAAPEPNKRSRKKVKGGPAGTPPPLPSIAEQCEALFDVWNGEPFTPNDRTIDVETDSLESRIGYSSLYRQMHHAFLRRVAYFRSARGGSMSPDQAREHAFHACEDYEIIESNFRYLMSSSLETLQFVDLKELHTAAPRVAERFWEMVKLEARQEFESGHWGANIMFPAGNLKGIWNLARYIGIRDSLGDKWKPKGASEMMLIEMLTETFFQWQYWLEQSVKRSQTPARNEDPELASWKAARRELNAHSRLKERIEGEWDRPYLSDKLAIEHAAQETERWHRSFLRMLKGLTDRRKYAPVTINNANQINFAADGGQQINLAKDGEP